MVSEDGLVYPLTRTVVPRKKRSLRCRLSWSID